MDDYMLKAEPFMFIFEGKLKEHQRGLLSVETEEEAILNMFFLQGMKRRALQQDPFMVRYYLHALQQNHFPHHSLRPTFRRAQRILYTRDQAIETLALNASLLELQETALEKNIPSSYLGTMDMPEFEEIDVMVKPHEYALRDELLLDQFGIGLWQRKH